MYTTLLKIILRGSCEDWTEDEEYDENGVLRTYFIPTRKSVANLCANLLDDEKDKEYVKMLFEKTNCYYSLDESKVEVNDKEAMLINADTGFGGLRGVISTEKSEIVVYLKGCAEVLLLLDEILGKYKEDSEERTSGFWYLYGIENHGIQLVDHRKHRCLRTSIK